jgi:hypothetical protein
VFNKRIYYGFFGRAIFRGIFEWCVQVPRQYDVLGGASENTRRQYQGGGEEEEMMLQYAIRQSLARPGDQVGGGAGPLMTKVDIYEALEGLPPGVAGGPGTGQGEDRQLQQAIQASMEEARAGGGLPAEGGGQPEPESDLEVALRLSQEQEREREARAAAEEEEVLRQVMALSLQEQ